MIVPNTVSLSILSHLPPNKNQTNHYQLIEASQGENAEVKGLLSTMAVNQDPEDRRNFLILVRASLRSKKRSS